MPDAVPPPQPAAIPPAFLPPSDPAPPTLHPAHASHFRVEASIPQFIRLAGFRHVFDRYHDHLDDAVCSFGPDDHVHCRCDAEHGTMDCDVPPLLAHPRYGPLHPDQPLHVTARVADFHTPSLPVRYGSAPFHDDHNVLLRADDGDDQHDSSFVAGSCCDSAGSAHSGGGGAGSGAGRAVFAAAERKDLTFHDRFLASLTRERRRKHDSKAYTLAHQCIAECIGTMFIVVFGVGSVCSAVLTGTSSGLWQIATVWGFGVALAICATASVSGAHLNPAVSLAMAIFRPHDFSPAKLLPYWAAQYAGGMLGGAFNLLLYNPLFRHFEEVNDFTRGDARSLLSARAFGEYFPDPGLVGGDAGLPSGLVSPAFALLVEAWGTGILMFVILALTDPRQKIIANKEMLPFYIGFTVAVLITLYAPLTQAGWNPARDFGPRVIAALAGWGKVAIPGPRNGFWVYIIGPKIGAPLGALLYDLLINPGLTD